MPVSSPQGGLSQSLVEHEATSHFISMWARFGSTGGSPGDGQIHNSGSFDPYRPDNVDCWGCGGGVEQVTEVKVDREAEKEEKKERGGGTVRYGRHARWRRNNELR